jgi:hypothetical protein
MGMLLFPICLSIALLLPQQKTICSSPGPTAWDQEDVHGKVKSVHLEEIHYSYTKPKLELKRKVVFDLSGNYVESEDPDMLPHVLTGPPPPSYIFNSACKPIERKETVVSEGIVKTTFRYDEWGRQIESAGIDEQGRLVYREVSLYDSNGKLTEQIETIRVHPEHFRPMRYDVYRNTRSEFHYDEHGNQTVEIEFDFTGKYYGKQVKRYDDKGRVIELTGFDLLDRPTEHAVSEYDSYGRLAAKEEYRSFMYERDNSLSPGTIKTRVGLYQMGTRYLFTYDGYGNWIEKKGFEIKETNGVRSLTLDSVEYRKIIYFD